MSFVLLTVYFIQQIIYILFYYACQVKLFYFYLYPCISFINNLMQYIYTLSSFYFILFYLYYVLFLLSSKMETHIV